MINMCEGNCINVHLSLAAPSPSSPPSPFLFLPVRPHFSFSLFSLFFFISFLHPSQFFSLLIAISFRWINEMPHRCAVFILWLWFLRLHRYQTIGWRPSPPLTQKLNFKIWKKYVLSSLCKVCRSFNHCICKSFQKKGGGGRIICFDVIWTNFF